MSVAENAVLRIVASMLWTDGNVVQNIYNATVSGASPPYDEQDIMDDAEAWMDALYATITTLISNNLDGNEVIVYKRDSVNDDWDEVGTQSWTWNPTAADEYLPRAVCALIKINTTDPDVQGKKYIAGMEENQILDGLWESTAITAFLNFGAEWLGDFTGGTSGSTWTPGVWSVKGNLQVPAGLSTSTTTIPAYQRRRKRNVGI